MQKKQERLKKELNSFGRAKEPFFFAISYDLSKFYIQKLSKLPNSIRYEINSNFKKSRKKSSLEKYPIDFELYKKSFDTLREEIINGNTYLANLTAQTKIKTSYSLDEIYKSVDAKYKLRFFYGDDDFVCFSPESFVKIEDNKIYTYPMKGTIDANIKDAKQKLLDNKKELAEHTMVVDLLRNDLGIVGKDIKVEKFRYLSKINAGDKQLYQTSSKISAILEDNYIEKIGDILVSMLPAGSISGTPKHSTVEILSRIENYKREYYTGVFGVFDGEKLESSVMIRFIQKSKNGLYYKSGGGITYDSNAIDEYNELKEKIYLPF